MALMVDLRAHSQELAHNRQLADVERKAFRVINHASKRVMCNTAQCCELAAKALQPHADEVEVAKVLRLLESTRAQSVHGFQMCRSMLLQAAIVRGEHQAADRDEFTMRSLIEDLGLSSEPRVDSKGSMRFSGILRSDKQLLTSIVFNATQNALQHGEADGKVVVDAFVAAAEDGHDMLRVTVSNRPGDGHDELRTALSASDTNDLLLTSLSELRRAGLRRMGLGDTRSTYLGLDEMRAFANAFRPSADVHLWVNPDSVIFELRVRVTVVSSSSTTNRAKVAPAVAPAFAAESPSTATSLPAGLAFVYCDDDEIPRLVAPLLISTANASVDESLVLGETYLEVEGLVERVLEMGRRLGSKNVVCVLDQHLDAYDEGSFLGTDLVKEMRSKGFEGLIIIHSANDGVEDEREYAAAGADGCVGKAVKGGTTAILSTISQLWYQRFGKEAVAAHETRPIMPSPPSSSAPSFKSSGSPSFKREGGLAEAIGEEALFIG